MFFKKKKKKILMIRLVDEKCWNGEENIWCDNADVDDIELSEKHRTRY